MQLIHSGTYCGCVRKLRQLTCCFAGLSGNDFAGIVCTSEAA